ncbi:DUF596 domain-containing protein [Rhizobium sp. P40RR-XXII]|uniref:DUF596 domain-containing protein n=1 Tax=Rhizobium sp. P40RR-XXII TaxID=2726739 RepID=UPI001456D1B2|nr:DUF596 domain-containing protein [Rhizobium sp. P40RR-XXII]NLS21384.1 DUF596 domain-containing protein [Rhizobium sp. P40RR-XXII]
MEKRWQEIVELSELWAFNGLWAFVRDEYKNFGEARDVFLGIVEALLDQKKIKLSKRGSLLKGSIAEQLSLLERSLPKDRRTMVLGIEATHSCSAQTDFDELTESAKMDEESLWFFRDECPAAIVWIRDDGSEEWT